MSLSLVYRAARSSLLVNSASRISLTPLSTRHASLSAINRGLVRSEKARPQGARPNKFNDLAEGGKRLNYAERRKAREELAKQRPDFKIRKGKKDITVQPDKAKPQSRRARFYDPESPFGKKSLVYQAKSGQLQGELLPKDRGSTDSAFERTGPRPDLRMPRRTVRKTARRRDGKGDRDTVDVADFVAELSRPAHSSGDGARGDAPSRSRETTRGRSAPGQHRDGPPRSRNSFGDRDAPRARDSFGDKDAFPRDRGAFGDRASPRGDRDVPRRDGFRDRDTPSGNRDISFKSRDSSFKSRDSPRQDRGGPREFSRRDRDTDRGFGDAPRPERDSFAPRDSPRRDGDYDRSFKDGDYDRGFRDAPYPERDSFAPRAERAPLSVTYTTAASQFLYGKSVVEAALRSSRRQFYHLYIYGGANRQKPTNDALIQALAKRKNIPITVLSEDGGMRLLDKMSASRPHNGFVLEASPLPQPPLTALAPLPEDYATNPRCAVTLGHQSAEEAAINGHPTSIPSPSPTHKPLILILDQILDPGNLGAILRTASFLGATAVGITRRGSATLTPVALKASSGAAESLALFSVSALPEFLNESRANGWAVYAAVAEGPSNGVKQRRHVDVRDVSETDPLRREPCVLLVGNEGEGLSRLVVKKADYEVNIPNLAVPGSGVDSLNVSVAVGLLCSAFLSGVSREMGGFGVLTGQGEGGGEVVKESLW